LSGTLHGITGGGGNYRHSSDGHWLSLASFSAAGFAFVL
jgi:hypothetical protein